MAKFEVVRFGDSRGRGAVVKVTTWLRSTFWTVLPGETEYTDQWVCCETGESKWAGVWKGDFIYKAQYRTQGVE